MKDTTHIALDQMLDVLSGVRAVFLDALKHDDLEFDTVVELQNISGDLYAVEKRLRELLESVVVD